MRCGTFASAAASIGKRQVDHRIAHLVGDRGLQIGARDQSAGRNRSPNGCLSD
jgi:hypothetical protein